MGKQGYQGYIESGTRNMQMDRLDEESFLDELMSLRRPEEAVAEEPWHASYPGSPTMMMSDLLFYGGEQGAPEARSGMDMGPFQEPMAPMQAAPPHNHEEFNFDYLSDVCNPYKSFLPGVFDAAGQALTHPLQLHDAMTEDETSGDKLFHGGCSTTFIFGGGPGENSEMTGMIRGVSGAHPRSKLNGGAPSKNLMAERRRRKRLNDRLSMLRSIVPKISKEGLAPELWHAAYPGSGTMMMSDLLFYGSEQGAPEAKSGIDMGSFQEPMTPLLHATLPHNHEEFSFDYLSEVCNPYRSFVPGVVDAAGQALTHPLQDATTEDETSGDKLFHGGGSTTSFIFGGVPGENSEMTGMIRGVSGAHPRSKLNGGAPSKNLMAERRRRKRLNDRLSMLRSIVPKISKMDRTSILGDTIDYVKELMERIKTLEEEIGATAEELNLLSTARNFSSGSNEEMMPMRNSTKFVVEKRGDSGTSIEICCATNPGVLFSTLSALEVLGLEIEQCVISCFGDFGMQASCSQEEGKRQVVSTDEIKQALYRSAGYGGTCL